MTTYTFDHTSRSLTEGNSPLYLAGDDLISRNLVIASANLEGRISAKSYSLGARQLLITNAAHTGRFSLRTFPHASRNLVFERSTLLGTLTGAKLFPEIVPSQVQFKPPRYFITEHKAQAGDLEVHLWADSSSSASLQLDYQNISDATAESVMSLWDSVYGTYRYLRIPRAVLTGVAQQLAEYMVKGGNNARWFFAEVPKWEGKLKGYGDLKVSLVSKISTISIVEGSNTGSGSTPETAGGTGGGTTSDPNFSSVSLLLPMNGSSGSTTFTDYSSNTKTVTANGSAQINTSIVKYGSGSAAFLSPNSTANYLYIPTSADFGFSNGPFTIEAWLYILGFGGDYCAIADIRNTGSGGNSVLFFYNSTGRVGYYTDSTLMTTTTIALNTWTHVALVRDSSLQSTIYIDGVASASFSDTSTKNSNHCYIGRVYDSVHYGVYGHIDDFRITKSIARYTSNFTPSASAFPTS